MKPKTIANMIENQLSYTNGWKITEEQYKEDCLKVANKIASRLDALVMLRPKEIALLKRLIETSSYLSNIAFNLKQKDALPKEDRKLLDIWQKDWDKKRSECKPILDKIFGAA